MNVFKKAGLFALSTCFMHNHPYLAFSMERLKCNAFNGTYWYSFIAILLWNVPARHALRTAELFLMFSAVSAADIWSKKTQVTGGRNPCCASPTRTDGTRLLSPVTLRTLTVATTLSSSSSFRVRVMSLNCFKRLARDASKWTSQRANFVRVLPFQGTGKRNLDNICSPVWSSCTST